MKGGNLVPILIFVALFGDKKKEKLVHQWLKWGGPQIIRCERHMRYKRGRTVSKSKELTNFLASSVPLAKPYPKRERNGEDDFKKRKMFYLLVLLRFLFICINEDLEGAL